MALSANKSGKTDGAGAGAGAVVAGRCKGMDGIVPGPLRRRYRHIPEWTKGRRFASKLLCVSATMGVVV
jgi:hypothetical protein